MCRSTLKYPLILDKFDGKKRIMFNMPIQFTDRWSVEKEAMYLRELRKALKGLSNFQTFNKELENLDVEVIKITSVPCGICDECLKARAKDWSTRIIMESKLYKSNYFVTLTYDDEHLPGINLVKDEISKFNKKLKVYLQRAGKPSNFRFYGVGEYGSHSARPHYHVIYFNLELDDLKFYKSTENGDLLYTSKFMEDCWSKGFVVIGDVTPYSADYVSRYVDKKRLLTPSQKEELKAKGIEPEFSVMSRRPGIGAYAYDYMKELMLNNENVPLPKGLNSNVPLYYSKKFKENENFDLVEAVQVQRDFNSSVAKFSRLQQAEYAHMRIDQLNDREVKAKPKKRDFS
nr:MAG: replication initiation protein [Microvirus Sku121]